MKRLFEGQVWHYTILLLLLLIAERVSLLFPASLSGELFGYSTKFYFILAIAIPILHQIYVWLFWRLELQHKTLTSLIERKAFILFKIDFLILFISRPVSIFFLAYSNQNTMRVSDLMSLSLSVILIIPVIYLVYSIKLYFGLDRAIGKDHFDSEWARKQALVRKGIFRITPNAMYVFGFLFLYIIVLLLKSQAAFIAAIFNHIYIWCHYYFTERIDMSYIFREDESVK